MDIKTKAEMYALLSTGKLGNTLPTYFSIDAWHHMRTPSDLWGIRSHVANGDKRMRLNVPTAEVADLYYQWFGVNGGGNITPMIDHVATFKAHVVEPSEYPGLHITYADCDPAVPWREAFAKHSRHASGIAALEILKHHLWHDDLDHIRHLLELYPHHVIELTACSRAVGLVHGRNTIIWEVRKY